MSEQDKNNGLVWINTPFRFTQLAGQYSLVKQHMLLTVSLHLQKYIDEYFVEKRQLGDARSDNVFEQGIDHVVMDVPPVKLELKDFKPDDGNMDYQSMRKVLQDEIGDMSVRFKDDKGFFVKQHIFSSVRIPTTKKGYTTDGKKFDRLKGYAYLEIDPKFVKSLFDMTKGYIHHLALIAKFSKNKNTPRFYIYLLRQIGLEKSMVVTIPYLELKSYLGLVNLDEHDQIIPDKEGEPTNNNYPKFSQFKKQVIEVVRKDLNRMAARNETDIVFDELQADDFIYPPGKSKGDPKFIRFHIHRTEVGELHSAEDKNADIAHTLNERYRQKSAAQNSKPVEGDIFAHVYQSPDKEIETDAGEGTDKWKDFLSRIIDDNQKSLLSRIAFVGMKNKRFCISCSDEDFKLLRPSGVEKSAQEYFGCVGSFAPVFYRG